MSHSARNHSHASSACVNCRQRKRKCSGTGPTCAACAEKGIQCEWSVESDGRRIGRKLQLENASLRAEVAELRALVDALRAGALEELSYYATQQLLPHLNGGHAGPALQIDAHPEQARGAADVSFLNVPLPGSNSDACSLRPTLDGQAGAAAVGVHTEPAGAQVNVFGAGSPPLYTGHALPEGSHV